MTEAFVRRCPFCSGDMLRSKSPARLVYTPPWGGVLRGPKISAYPWACMSCGVILYYVQSLPALAAEYREKQAAQPAPTAPTPLKS